MSRVLGRIRLSRATEESTSVDRQRELIQRWADDNGHTVVAWAEDIDVSGSISPFDAPALAPYLSERAGEWDILVAWKLDRIARTSIPMHKLFGWIQDHNKTLVCISDNIDLSNWVGRLVASVVAGVAEGELEAIRERATASYKKLAELGRYPGGSIPYGYQPIQIRGGGFRLEPDPVTMPILREIIRRYLNGSSLTAIVDWLNESGYPTSRDHFEGKTGTPWRINALSVILRSKNLLGWAVFKGQVLLDEQGKPIVKTEPVVDMDTYQRIQERLNNASFTKAVPDRTSPLLGVLLCWNCGERMHYVNNPYDNGINSSYSCAKSCTGGRVGINAAQIEPMVNQMFLDTLGDFRLTEKRVTPANDLSLEISETEAAYNDLVAYIPNARTAEARTKLFAQLDLIEQRLQQLRSESTTADTVEWIESGQTYRDLWETLDTEGRRQLMLKAGVSVRANRLKRGNRYNRNQILETEFVVPEDLKERLGIQS